MKIEVCNSYESLSIRAKDIIIGKLQQHKALLLCAATGGSPTRMYELLVEQSILCPELFSQFRVIKLDEWGGISMEHPGTCENYLQQHVIRPLNLSDDRYISFQSDARKPEEECNKIQQMLEENGPIDICILGIGMNGHIALNEPADFLQPNCHIATLSEKSLQHPMISGDVEKPQYGLTLGMADILQSKLIILLINGSKKKKIAKLLLSKKITNELPASFLWLHPNVFCLIDEEAASI